MDKEARGENSSSQNVNLEVIDIKRGAYGNAECIFSDSSSFFIHSEAAMEYGLRVGERFTGDRLKDLLLRSAQFAARDKAVEYLARREHSGHELVLKLMKKDYDRETAAAAVDMLRERGYVNDSRFADLWIESRLKRHPEGRSMLLAGLAAKGVERGTAEDAVNEHYTQEESDRALRRCTEKYLRGRDVPQQKLINHLLRRGFSYGEIKRHITDPEREISL